MREMSQHIAATSPGPVPIRDGAPYFVGGMARSDAYQLLNDREAPPQYAVCPLSCLVGEDACRHSVVGEGGLSFGCGSVLLSGNDERMSSLKVIR